ncbi:hypothetical protein LIER_16451 [Lithospermum erythrorhizon]|uniref:RNase H type-1 domain-containing protein n=1 Tax=Lithospermum erythrorhizon TaxID=34254 RepID=A0AAV3Q847_LITER
MGSFYASKVFPRYPPSTSYLYSAIFTLLESIIEIGDGSCDFWMDPWLHSGPLLNHSAGLVPVNDFMTDGYWNLLKLHEYGPNDQVSNILQCEVRRERSDEVIWKASNHGNFNFKATWQLIREIQPFSGVHKAIWYKSIPKKVSFTVRRIVQSWLPVDNILQKRGITLASKCQFCGSGENIDHIFIECEMAKSVWQYLHDLFGIQYKNYSSPFHLLINWLDKSPIVGHIRMVIACIALWAIWEGRHKNKNEDRVISKATILSRIFQQIKLLGDGGIFKPVNWRGDLHRVTSFGCNLRVESPSLPRVVKWTKPPDGHFKLNTDGASKGNPGESGCGGILKDKEGSIIMAFGVYLGRETSIVAELKAIQEGLHKLCIKGIRDVMVETDSQLSIQLIRSTCCNWKLRPMVNNIKDMAEICNA